MLEKLIPKLSTNSMRNWLSSSTFQRLASLILALAALIGSLAISSIFSSLLFLRYFLGLVLVFFLPGYTFLRLLLGPKMTFTGNLKMDYVEVFGFSIGLSMVIVPIIGLALNFTPWGISFESLIVGLFIATTVFIIGAVLREREETIAK
jgi:uncharacterized membrane protein